MKTILVVDDQPELRQLVCLTLGEERYRILQAADGRAALELAAAEVPDLIVLDLTMPGEPDGFGVCRRLRSDPLLAQVRVLILSGRSGFESQRACEDAGADAFCPKPFSPAQLAVRVEALLAAGQQEAPSRRTRVLVVDDRPEIRRLVSLTLGCADYDVAEACDGESALHAIRRQRPQLVVLDLMMPGALNGLDVCGAVKRDAGLAGTRVLMLTARGQQEDRVAGRRAGADDYVVKPFSPLDLIARVDRLLSTT